MNKREKERMKRAAGSMDGQPEQWTAGLVDGRTAGQWPGWTMAGAMAVQWPDKMN